MDPKPTPKHPTNSLTTTTMSPPPQLSDEEAAILAIQSFPPSSQLTKSQLEATTIITATLSSPAPFVEDPQALFAAYTTLYFRSLLHGTTTLAWSNRMKSCAGTCSLLVDKATSRPKDPREVAVRLSEALLKFRPRSDTINTLLHEMIHAYLFLAGGKHIRGDDPTGHGAGFQMLAASINQHGGYDITTTHTFHDEVVNYQTHVWQCSGSCKDLPPHFGAVRRAMNRPPGPSDSWYLRHQEQCSGGTWIKVSEPPPKEKKGKKPVQKNRIDKWVVKTIPGNAGTPILGDGGENGKIDAVNLPGAVGRGVEPLGLKKRNLVDCGSVEASKRLRKEDGHPMTTAVESRMVECPVCLQRIPQRDINTHLDTVHGF